MTKIQVLPPEEARKIAAGEVIDRPAALVREFMDNAIDAGCSLVEVSIEGGGIIRTEVSDDGEGMAKEDLELCWLTHATSKIRSLDDLKIAETLGFRGEALAAASAVSHLEILTSQNGREAWKLDVGPGEKSPPLLEQSLRSRGTSVRALGLFDTIPARKRFLKREGSEAASCKAIFNDKAMAFPSLGFRFMQDGTLKTFLSPASSLKERFSQIVISGNEASFLHEIAASGTGFSAVIVVGGPEIFRNDKRQQYIFANGRRIQDYSLTQALEYGVQGWFPNGTHPVGAVFVDIDPALADFNIHPAKREVRFAAPGSIHHAITSALRDFCHHRNLSTAPTDENTGREFHFDTFAANNESSRMAMEALLSKPPEFVSFRTGWAAEGSPPYADQQGNPGTAKTGSIRYLGRLFDLFILAQKEDRLFIIDQHAAHERILYDRFLNSPIPKQELLVSIPFTVESSEDDSFLKTRQTDLEKLGIEITEGDGEWLIEALPADWRLNDEKTVQAILELKDAGEDIAERWAATLSCHGAIKDGDYLDPASALAFAEEALMLPVHLCPHGRPIYFELSRENLLKAVKRI
ncbi:DNA mismatch repair endonuclease MutL [Leadbettera azotonutricia]|uniref:DNA mismatch repair protein MutL n=1 Tax=Leadbettera azotonutricia (strain ATCC BAA-888 / DSM 13862 / ZAS-9) TaxID=545695 RepID=F5Y7U3_LEAAZ|nr:DNA mismatch repair endonuclease MutL [Leadbettera azotonutricia]AEF80285.1 DNA mismatch repair protein [Leadbettera azotonutricia ZAS-9]